MTNVLQALKATISTNMSWTNLTYTPSLSLNGVKQDKNWNPNGYFDAGILGDGAEVVSAADGQYVAEHQFGMLIGRFKSKTDRDNALADLIAELPGEGFLPFNIIEKPALVRFKNGRTEEFYYVGITLSRVES